MTPMTLKASQGSQMKVGAQAPRVHVAPRQDGWVVKSEGAKRADRVFDDKEDALHRGRELAGAKSSDLVVHSDDGNVADVLPSQWVDGDVAYHVCPRDDGTWTVTKAGNDNPSRVAATKHEAVQAAQGFARNQSGTLYVHLGNGVIEDVRDFRPAPADE